MSPDEADPEALAQAADPRTAPAHLLTLSTHAGSEVRRRVASNPATPLEGLLALLLEFPDEVTANAALAVHRMATPLLLAQAPPELRRRWTESARLADWAREEMARFEPVLELRLWSVRRMTGEPGLLSELTSRVIQDEADRLPGDEMARHEWGYSVRRDVAQDPSCSPALLGRLAACEDEEVRVHVADNPSCPRELLEILAGDESASVRSVVFRHPDCPPSLFERVLTDPDQMLRSRVASLATTPLWLLEQLAADTNVYVRVFVARNPRSPAAVLARLATDPDERVRAGVAANPSHRPAT